MSLRQVCRGDWGQVGLIVGPDGRCPAGEFIAALGAGDKAKIQALFQRFANEGKIVNREKFKKIADKVFEFKSFQIRMFCFVEHAQVLVTHGTKKKKDELNPADIKRSIRIRAEYGAPPKGPVKIGKVQ